MDTFLSIIVIGCLVLPSMIFIVPATANEHSGDDDAVSAVHAETDTHDSRSRRSAEPSYLNWDDDISEIHERETRNVRRPGPGRGRAGPHLNANANAGGRNERNEDSPVKIYVPPCERVGTTLVEGLTNYYMKCVINKKTGGYFQTLFICPANTMTDKSTCIPPPDCAKCGEKK